ncbi:MAG: NlpC/P60 family protein [Mangrovicoccus sp.]
MWTDEWIGLPYQSLGRGPESYDCLGLFLAVQRARYGRILPDPLCTMSEAARRRIVDASMPLWRRVDHAQEGDAVLFRVRGMVLHVGLALGPQLMLHVEDEAASVIEDFASVTWGQRLEGIYTYAG